VNSLQSCSLSFIFHAPYVQLYELGVKCINPISPSLSQTVFGELLRSLTPLIY
jgi:hypothetical protein